MCMPYTDLKTWECVFVGLAFLLYVGHARFHFNRLIVYAAPFINKYNNNLTGAGVMPFSTFKFNFIQALQMSLASGSLQLNFYPFSLVSQVSRCRVRPMPFVRNPASSLGLSDSKLNLTVAQCKHPNVMWFCLGVSCRLDMPEMALGLQNIIFGWEL